MFFRRSNSEDLLQLTVLKYGVGAGKAGYVGFMVTVDAPRLGNRIADERNKYVHNVQYTADYCHLHLTMCQISCNTANYSH